MNIKNGKNKARKKWLDFALRNIKEKQTVSKRRFNMKQ